MLANGFVFDKVRQLSTDLALNSVVEGCRLRPDDAGWSASGVAGRTSNATALLGPVGDGSPRVVFSHVGLAVAVVSVSDAGGGCL